MDDRTEYHQQLVSALSEKADQLERTSILKLREHFQGFTAGVNAIYKFLIEKGLIQNDPYKHERSVTDIEIPSNEPFPDSDALHEISQRFSHYVSQWDFMINIFHVSLPNFSLKNIRKLVDLLDWIRWTDFSANSSYQITRAFAGIVGKVTQMNDPMAGKIITSSATHLRDLTKEIKTELKNITVFIRERYKWRVREELINRMDIDPEQYKRNPPDVMNNVKFEFAHNPKKLGWYKDLVKELLDEDFGEQFESKRQAALDRLKVARASEKKKKKNGPDDRATLLGIVDKMARSGEPIRSAIVKMNENSRNIQDRKKSFGERLSEIIQTLFHRSEDHVVYEIAIKDVVTGSTRHEALRFDVFTSTAVKKARALSDLQDNSSGPYKNVRAAGAPQLQEFIEKNLADLKNMHRRLMGLENYFQSTAVPMEVRSMMKPCSLNLKNLKTTIGDTLRAMNEFKSRKEEEAQLKKLGIQD